MKIKIIFKNPDAVDQAIEDLGIKRYSEEAEVMKDVISEWVSGGEYARIEIDTETGKAIVIPAK